MLSPRRHSAWIPWIGAVVLGLGVVLLVGNLYRTAQREVTQQANQIIEIERSRFLDFANDYLGNARDSSMAELVAFHDEGLSYALSRWDESNQSILDTFIWTPDSSSATDIPSQLWTRNLGFEDPAFESLRFTPRDRPDILNPPDGYQAENLEIVRYAGRATSPEAGWAASRQDPEKPWLIWYRTGPNEPVRGAWVDIGILLKDLETALPNARICRAHIVSESPLENLGSTPLTGLPAYRVEFAMGDVFESKRSNTRLIGATAGLLLATALFGAGFLIRSSQRHAREARQKTTFVSLVSHELRTPITSIHMFADMLATSKLTDTKRDRFIGTIQKEAKRLSHLIERLLTFNALNQKEQPLQLESVNLATEVAEVIELCAPLAAEAGLRLDYRPPDFETQEMTSPTAIRQALRNLLDNAAKYALNSGSVLIKLSRELDHFTITLSDQGPGIPATRASEIFNAFVQGSDNLHDRPDGLGLGLAISRTGLRACGGDLILTPSKKGATFEIRIPATTPSP